MDKITITEEKLSMIKAHYMSMGVAAGMATAFAIVAVATSTYYLFIPAAITGVMHMLLTTVKN